MERRWRCSDSTRVCQTPAFGGRGEGEEGLSWLGEECFYPLVCPSLLMRRMCSFRQTLWIHEQQKHYQNLKSHQR